MSGILRILFGAGFTAAALCVTVFLYLRQFRGIRLRDWSFLFKGLYLKRYDARNVKTRHNTAQLFEKTLKKHGRDHQAMLFEDRVMTLGEAEDLSNKIARFALSKKLNAGDIVALYMGSRPEYICIWLGFAKVGVRCALINFNLLSDPLYQSLEISQAKLLIFGEELQGTLKTMIDSHKALPMEFFCYGKNSASFPWAKSFDEVLSPMPSTPVPKNETAYEKGVTCKDPLVYIYTSGTTGLPKAAILTHNRFQATACGFTILFNVSSKDTVYCALPLYHSAAGVIGVGMMMVAGAKLVIRAKFSASQFWSDVRKYKVTIIQYIGEVCRYTLAQPPHPEDGNNSCRLAVGNGLRPDIWEQFQKRFNIKQIGEFYAATEGPAALVNTENKKGAIGFVSPLVSAIMPNSLVKYDVKKEELVRGSDGFCIKCQPGEQGELLAKVIVKNDGKYDNFAGYTNSEASKKKLVRDVFKKGDLWFRSGDLLRSDKEGFVYFVDRIGDTFRWKGENVATTQVGEVLSSFPNCEQVTVYGVEIPNKEGRIGMAAISEPLEEFGEIDRKKHENLEAAIDWKGLAKHVADHLPSYSRPYFVRVLPSMGTTGTFKVVKSELRDEGFNIEKIKDPIYFLTDEGYVRLDSKLYNGILDGTVRL